MTHNTIFNNFYSIMFTHELNNLLLYKIIVYHAYNEKSFHQNKMIRMTDFCIIVKPQQLELIGADYTSNNKKLGINGEIGKN